MWFFPHCASLAWLGCSWLVASWPSFHLVEIAWESGICQRLVGAAFLLAVVRSLAASTCLCSPSFPHQVLATSSKWPLCTQGAIFHSFPTLVSISPCSGLWCCWWCLLLALGFLTIFSPLKSPLRISLGTLGSHTRKPRGGGVSALPCGMGGVS